MRDLITITTEHNISNKYIESDGFYNIIKHGNSFDFEGLIYTYYSSGLCRTVYKSKCGNYVIKIPNGAGFHDLEKIEDVIYYDITVSHNYYEAKAYENCPDELKIFLAKTELLPNCWVRQELIEVKSCSFLMQHDFREIGKRKDGSYCIFDYDPLLIDYKATDFNYSELPKLVNKASKNNSL